MKVSMILPYYKRKKYLRATLNSLVAFYLDQDLEVVIVDDGSPDGEKAEELLKEEFWYGLDVKCIYLANKNGINPCLPYNVGVRQSTGEVLILSSPETIHTTSMFALANDFKDLTIKDYYAFSVFCPTRQEINDLALIADTAERLAFVREKVETRAYSGLGANGRDGFNNEYGSWYLHSKHRPSALNFFTAMRRELYYELCGFDERFRGGTGFDDNGFRDRLLARIGGPDKVRYFDNALALHLNHPPVYGSGNPVSNQSLFNRIKDGLEPPYQPNDNWGKHGT